MSNQRPIPVLFIAAPEYSVACSEIMSRMTRAAKKDRVVGNVELIGCLSRSFQISADWLVSLKASGVNPQEVRCAVLWGECALQFGFEIPSSVTDISLGNIVLPEQSTIIPVLCLPTRLSGNHWGKPEFWDSAKDQYTNLLVNGRTALPGDEPVKYITFKNANLN